MPNVPDLRLVGPPKDGDVEVWDTALGQWALTSNAILTAVGGVVTVNNFVALGTATINASAQTQNVTFTNQGALQSFGHYAAVGVAPASVVAGANAGTSPPAPVQTTANDTRGVITFGTGTSPAAGAMVVVTFNFTYPGGIPGIALTWGNAAAAGLGQVYVTAPLGGQSFTVNCTTAPAASQPNTTYVVHYIVMG